MGQRMRAVAALSLVLTGTLITSQAQTDKPAPPDRSTELREKAIDLTYPFDENTVYWPADKSFHWEKTRWGLNEQGHWYASAIYSASEHGGTHLDSPIHFGKGQITADQIPISKLIGPAVVVDVREACAKDRDYTLKVDDLLRWEKAHHAIPAGAIVLVHTGWGKFWPEKSKYLGDAKQGDTSNLHFPGISSEAAKWLVAQRKVSGVGIDTASLDHGPSREYNAHRTLNGAGIYGLENVANLEKVPEVGATVIALPMKIKGGSGGPTRIIAILP